MNSRQQTDKALAMLASCLGDHAGLVWPVRDALYCERRGRTLGTFCGAVLLLLLAFVVGTILEAVFLTYGGCG